MKEIDWKKLIKLQEEYNLITLKIQNIIEKWKNQKLLTK